VFHWLPYSPAYAPCTFGWEEYFTVVQSDQRAAGKTYLLTDPAIIAPTLTPERMIGDAEEMVAWVRRELGKDKIFVLGHSFGSFLAYRLRSVTQNGCMPI
jgi:proline iminopeptidase